MPRTRGKSEGTRAVRVDVALRRRYGALHDATSAWLDGGDFEPVAKALDAIALENAPDSHSALTPDMLREERILILTQRFTTASQMVTRLQRELSAAAGLRQELRDQLLVTIAEPPNVPEYVVKLWDRLKVAGAGQMDLQPQSHALAKTILDAARAYNSERRGRDESEINSETESLIKEPVTTWRKLPRLFSGFQLVDVEPAEVHDPEPCELPPSTDIAYFASDKTLPEFSHSRRETYNEWSTMILDWARRQDRSITRQHARIWAMLLAHRMSPDDSFVPDLLGEELRSPWSKGGVVRIGRDDMAKDHAS